MKYFTKLANKLLPKTENKDGSVTFSGKDGQSHTYTPGETLGPVNVGSKATLTRSSDGTKNYSKDTKLTNSDGTPFKTSGTFTKGAGKYFTKTARVYLPDGSSMSGQLSHSTNSQANKGGGWGKWLVGGAAALLGGWAGLRYFGAKGVQKGLATVSKSTVKGKPPKVPKKSKFNINQNDVIDMVDDGTGTFVPKFAKYYGPKLFKEAILKVSNQPLFKTDAKNPMSKKRHTEKAMDLTGEKQPTPKPLDIKDAKEKQVIK